MSDLGLDKSDLLLALGATPIPGRQGGEQLLPGGDTQLCLGELCEKIQIGDGGWGGFHFFGF